MMKKAAMSEKRLITAFLLCRQTGIDVLRQPSGSACCFILLLLRLFGSFRNCVFFQLFIAVFDDFFTGNDTDKESLIVYDRNKVLVDGAVQKVFHFGICVNCLIGSTARDCHNGNIFSRLQI